MSGLGAGHVRLDFMESGQKSDKSGFFGIFGLWIDFDGLHFTDSLNASSLIV
jgi:hypothetical protein